MVRHPSLTCLLLMAVSACSADRPKPADSKHPEHPLPANGTASIRGTVTLKGKAPPQKPINPMALTGIPLQVPPGLRTERVVVDANNRMQWVFVYIKSGLTDTPVAAPQEVRELAFEGFRYVPHALGVMLGQGLRVRNADPETHLFHCTGDNEVTRILKAGAVTEVSLLQPNVMALLKCDIHPWERGWIAALPHPFFAVTDSSGAYEIPGMPPGKYTVEAWHEYYLPVTQEIEIKDGSPVHVDLTLEEPLHPR